MNRSSSHSQNVHETKGQKLARSFLAFALFLLISALSLVICVRVSFINPDSVAKVFSNDNYVTELRADILDYTHETLKRNMLPEECLDETVSYKAVHDISYAYAVGTIGTSEDYNETAYQGLLDTLAADMKTAIDDTVSSLELTVDENRIEDGSELLSKKLEEHYAKRIEKPYMNKVSDVVKIGNYVTIIAIAVLALFAVLLALIVASIGEKKYRALRYLVHSINAAALLNLLLAGGVTAIERFKELYIFPSYFQASVMSYINGCVATVAASALIMLFVSFILTVIIWKINRDSKK